MLLSELRFNAQRAAKDFHTATDPVMKRRYQKALDNANQALRDAQRFGSFDVPMRTPWKRLQGPSKRYFEEV